jgi:hypothetical protein
MGLIFGVLQISHDFTETAIRDARQTSKATADAGFAISCYA